MRIRFSPAAAFDAGIKGIFGGTMGSAMDGEPLTLLCVVEEPTGGSCWHRRRLKQNNTILDLITSSGTARALEELLLLLV
jgi:hypothetical protein